MEPNNPAHKNEPVSDISPLPVPQITNVVSTAHLGINLDLAKISLKLTNLKVLNIDLILIILALLEWK